jgi:tetratricopeptide (TPR) repeat protein
MRYSIHWGGSMNLWTNRGFAVLIAVMLGGPPLLGQQRGPASSVGPPSSVSGTRGNPTLPGTQPTLNPNGTNNSTNNPFPDRPIFLAGKVVFDDASPLNADIGIQRVCGANVRTEAHTDSKGRFSFQLGNKSSAAVSEADSSQADYEGSNSRAQDSGFGDTNRLGNRTSETALWGCELRASYPGYRSDSVSLDGRRSLDDPNVGTIILHRLSNVQGTTISITTAEAPKAAQKNFEKALQAERKGNLDEAEKHLLAATGEYPKYALAWFTLGQLQQGRNKLDDARKSYIAAAEADRKYVSPYDQLARLAALEGKWEEAANYSKQAIELNPVEFPSSFWYNTLANYNLNKPTDALRSAQALLKLDTSHRYPETNRILAEIALHSNDYAAAAGYLRAYLALVPNAKDADALKQQLLKIDEARAPLNK